MSDTGSAHLAFSLEETPIMKKNIFDSQGYICNLKWRKLFPISISLGLD
jgi:hypothetical protein